MHFHTKPFKTPPKILKEGEGGGRKIKREGGEKEVWWNWEKRG